MFCLVSVIIPVYNSSKYIKKTIESVLCQTYSNIEVIVVDDGSSDDSVEIVNSINDCRIKIVQQSNQGPSAARNKGMDLAVGKYIAFNDADDTWVKNKLELQLLKLNESLAYTCISDVNMTNELGKTIGSRSQKLSSDLINDILLHRITNFTPTLLFKNESCIRFDPFLRYSEDYLFLIELSKLGQVVNVASPLINRRVHDESTSQNLNVDEYINSNTIFSEKVRELKGGGYSKKILSYMNYAVALSHFKNESYKKSMYYIKESLSLKVAIKPLIMYCLCLFKSRKK